MIHLPDNIELLIFASAIAVASFGFLFYYYFSESNRIKFFLKTENGETRFVVFQRFLGVVIFGCLPLLIIFLSGAKGIADFGVDSPKPETYLWILVLSAILIPINYFNSRTVGNLKLYPQIRAKVWPVSLLILSAVSWIAYLLSYEFLFRGFLLFSSVHLLGLWPAMVVNTSIYALVHIPKGYKETIGAIPLGILLCYLTVRTGSIWVAVFTHIIMALSNEWLSLRAHPQMSIKILRK